MAEFVENALVSVPQNGNIPFSDASVPYPFIFGSVLHREGSGLVTLRGVSRNPWARFALYRVSYSTNAAIPTDGTVEPVSVAISINGEALSTSTAIITPAAVDEFWHISDSTDVLVPLGCCLEVAVKNISTQEIQFQNSSLTVERIG